MLTRLLVPGCRLLSRSCLYRTPAARAAAAFSSRAFRGSGRDEMEANAQLFSGLAGVLDRTAAFKTAEGKEITRTTAQSDFLDALLRPDTGAETLLFFDGRCAASVHSCNDAACGGHKPGKMELLRVPLHLALSSLAGEGGHEAAARHFKEKALVLGTLHSEAGGKAAPIAAMELKELGEDEATARIKEWLAASHSNSSAGSACKCPRCGGEATLTASYVEGRKMIFEQANPCRPAASSTAAPGSLLQPKEIAWPITFQEAALFGMARSLLVWRSKTKFCSCCGGKLEAVEGGVKMTCLSCKQSAWQRTDPVTICAVTNKARTHLLLGRQPAFPPGYFSTLAGFLEPGESIEDAARREIKEESGIVLSEVRYVTSQHWPIGRGTYGQVMIGLIATAATEDITADKEELEDCRWFSREEVETAVRSHFKERERSASPGRGGGGGGGAWGGSDSAAMKLKVPGPFAIAHALMQTWLKETEGTTMA